MFRTQFSNDTGADPDNLGSALAIVLAFKNQQCYARFDDALEISAQLTPSSLVLANKLTSTIGSLDAAQSSNPFEGGANDVPISFIARRIEIEMRIMLGEQTDLKPIEAKHDILF